MEFTLEQIAVHIKSDFVGKADRVIRGVAPIDKAGPDHISFAADPRWERELSRTQAGAVIVRSDPGVEGLDFIINENPRLVFIQVVQMFHPILRSFDGISPQAVIADDAVVAQPISIGPYTVVGHRTSVGPRTVIAAGVVIGEGVTIGADCTLRPKVVIEDGVSIGDRVTIHAGTIIGADGYGYVYHDGANLKIPQVGSVRIGNDVEIGANVCVDRGALGDTVIEDDVKIDNLVQVGHSVRIGKGSLIVAQVGLSGSSDIGKRCVMAGRAGLKDHVSIGDGATVAAASVVTHDIKPGEVVAGYPAGDIGTWRKSMVILRNLPRHWPSILSLLKQAEKD